MNFATFRMSVLPGLRNSAVRDLGPRDCSKLRVTADGLGIG